MAASGGTVVELEVGGQIGGLLGSKGVAVSGEILRRADGVPDAQLVELEGEAGRGGRQVADDKVALLACHSDEAIELGSAVAVLDSVGVCDDRDRIEVDCGLVDGERDVGPGLLACGEAIQRDLPCSAHDEVVADRECDPAIHEFHLEVALCSLGGGGLLEKRSVEPRVGGQAEPELAGPGPLVADQVVERLNVCERSSASWDGLDISGDLLFVVVEGRDLDVVALKDQVDSAVVPGAGRVEGIRAGESFLPVINAIAVGVCLGGVGLVDRVFVFVEEPVAVIVHMAVGRIKDGGVLEHGGHVGHGAMEDDRVGIGLGDADILSVDFCPVRARN